MGKDTGISDRIPLVTDRLLDTEKAAKLLNVSRLRIAQLRREAGLPAIDIGLQRQGRRDKHLWRYNLGELLEWARKRGNTKL